MEPAQDPGLTTGWTLRARHPRVSLDVRWLDVDISNQLKQWLVELDIKRHDAIILPSGGGRLRFDLEVSPEEFLMRAEDDYELGGSAAQLNVVTNAKRAIYAQIDEVLLALGFESRRWDIRRKLNGFASLGFLSPRVLKKVASARNIL
jgi:hypothetical protein